MRCSRALSRPQVVGSYLLSEFASSDTKRNTPMPTFPELIHEDSIAGLKTWEFNQWELQEQDLLPLLKEMFDSFGLVQRFKIPVPKLERFIMKVRDSYRDNPYHNFRHAFDVTQTVYAVLTTMVWRPLLLLPLATTVAVTVAVVAAAACRATETHACYSLYVA